MNWNELLDTLRGQMPRSVFDSHLKRAKGVYQDGKLTISLHNEIAYAWVTERLYPVIRRAAENAAEGEIEIEYQLQPQPDQLELELSGTYENEYTAIVKPDQVFVGTQYFRRVWLPVLGPTLGWLIIELRQRCYWNKKTGEKREHCQATHAELAAAVGVSERTVYRILKPGPLVDEFILDRQTIKEYSAKAGRIANATTHWTIRLDEPIFDPEKHILSN